MPKVLWASPEEKAREWMFAKEQLSHKPDGTKLRRKDNVGVLTHSFMVIDGRILAISGQGIRLGKGSSAKTKLAEDENGNPFALKIIKRRDGGLSSSAKESEIAYDLGIAGKPVTRTSERFPIKYYIPYSYLGTSLLGYINTHTLSLDQCFELCIKLSLALHDIHSGRTTKSKKAYHHCDVHWGNILIDDQGDPHFIDFGLAREAYDYLTPKDREDIVEMLAIFFTPIKDREDSMDLHKDWIFGNWMGEYTFCNNRPPINPKTLEYVADRHTIYIYRELCSQREDGVYSQLHYLVKDSAGILQNGLINLETLGLSQLPSAEEGLPAFWECISDADLSRIRAEAFAIACQNNHAISPKNRNPVLFNLLQDPYAFYDTATIPTALDIAETLTLCRLQLEDFQAVLTAYPPESRLAAIHLLNTVSNLLLTLYEKLQALPNKGQDLESLIKQVIFAQVIRLLENSDEPSVIQELPEGIQEADAQSIGQSVNAITSSLAKAKRDWEAKNQSTFTTPTTSGLSFFVDAGADSNVPMNLQVSLT